MAARVAVVRSARWLPLLGLGGLLAWLVFRDGLWSHRLQVQNVGVNPSAFNDVPYVLTTQACIVALTAIVLVGWILKSGEFDRPLMGLLAFSFFSATLLATYQGTVALIVLVLMARGMRRGSIPFVFTPMIFPVGAILISYATTLIYSGKVGSVLPNMFFRFTYMAMFFLLPNIIRTRRHLATLLHYLIIMACICATVAIAQFFLSIAFGRPISYASSNAAKTTTPFGQVARVTGFMSHPNHAAQAFSSICVLLIYFATRPPEFIQKKTRILYFAAAFYLGIAVFLTFSRSGWLSLGLSTMLVPFLRWPRYAPYFFIVLAVVGVIGIQTGAVQYAYKTVYEFNAASAGFREKEDAVALMGFVDSPILGQGVQGSPKFYNPFNLQVHNTYLQILTEMGLFGLSTFVFLGALLFIRWLERFFHATNRIDRDWLIGLGVCLAATAVQGKFTLFLWIRFSWLLLALMETVIIISRTQVGDEEPDDLIFLPKPEPRPLPVLAPSPVPT